RFAARGAWANAAGRLAAAARLSATQAAYEQNRLEAVECGLLAGEVPDVGEVAQEIASFAPSGWRSYLLGRLSLFDLERAEALLTDAWHRCDPEAEPLLGARIAGQFAALYGSMMRGAEMAEWAQLALRLGTHHKTPAAQRRGQGAPAGRTEGPPAPASASGPMSSGPMASGHTEPDSMASHLTASGLMASGDTESAHMASGHTAAAEDTGSGYMEPGHTGSGYMESGGTEPGRTGSDLTGSGDTESAYMASGHTAAAEDTGSGYMEPGHTGSGYMESGGTEPGRTGSDLTGSGDTESAYMASGHTAAAEDTGSGYMEPGHTGSGYMESGGTEPGRTGSDLMASGDTESAHMASDPTAATEDTASSHTKPGHMASDHTDPEHTAPDGTATDMIRYLALTGRAMNGEAPQALAELVARGPLPDPAVAGPAELEELLGRGTLREFAGDPNGAVRDLAGVFAHCHARAASFRVVAATGLASAEYRAGHWDDASVHADFALTLAADTDQPHVALYCRMLSALLHAARGDFAKAQAHSHVLAEYARFGHLSPTLWAALAAAHLARARGDAEGVVVALDPLTALTGRGDLEVPGGLSWTWL
ncbi:hypothetical protein P8605_46735, partial [Streptomyces sp. T-3]|nr:hypothetical protein [Streptomyces sp. T-3]